ncbi:TetR/AcrR family transcriptional regulator [bacterium]|nr:MAG: TetR/AcrR family transcriptional regulator [bacterium]
MTATPDHRIETGRKKSAETKGRILDSTLVLLREKKLDIIITDVCNHATVSQPTTSRHFGSIEKIIYHAIMLLYGRLKGVAEPSSDEANSHKALWLWLELFYSEDGVLILTGVCSPIRNPRKIDGKYKRLLRRSLVQDLSDILEQCMSEHSLAVSINTRRLASTTITRIIKEVTVQKLDYAHSCLNLYGDLVRMMEPEAVSSA